MIGYKYKMSNIEAAIGLGQIERVDVLVARKQQILATYRAGLEGLREVTLNPVPEDPTSALGAWMPTVVFSERSGVTRELMAETFERANIDARVFFHPLSSLPMFEPQLDNVHAYSLARRAFNLPSFHDMTEHEQARVINVIRGLAEAGA